ncbi:MAG: hypothetical protein M3Q73_03295, partial [bacterium]|nr:hypothetical protein [bacterium]
MKNSLNNYRRWFKKSRFGVPQLFVFFIIFSLVFQGFPAPLAQAAPGVPNILSYQGRLTDASGNLLGGSGTTYYFKFSIWDSPTVGGGNRVWPISAPGTITQTVRQGVFHANIGDTANGYPDTLNYDFSQNSSAYLQVEVSANNTTFETLAPRQQITSTAYAQTAGNVRGTGSSTFGTNSVIGNSVVSIAASSSNATALSIQAATAQAADLFSILSSNGTKLAFVTATGGIQASSTLQVGGDALFYGNLTVNSGLATFGQASTSLLSSTNGLFIGSSGITRIYGDLATSTFAGGISIGGGGINVTTGGVRISSLANCDTIDTDASGNLSCGTDSTGAGGGISTVQVDDSTVVSSATVLDFTGADFSVTNSPAGEANISIVRSGDWTGTFDGQEGSYYLNANNLTNFGLPFYNFFSSTTTDALAEGTTNLYYSLGRVAAAIAGTTTDALDEGATNLYFTNARADARADVRINATTSISTLNALPNLSTVGTITSGTWQGTAIADGFLTKTGDWTGTFDGLEGSNYLANSFSTTSAAFWLTTKSTTDLGEGTNLYYTLNRFSSALAGTTTTALAEGSNLYFTNARADGRIAALIAATTTTALAEGTNLYYTPDRVNTLINGSTTIAKTYSANVFTNANTFNGALTVGSLNGPLQANNGVVSATSSVGVLYGGTGLASTPSYGQLLVGNNAGGYTLTSTSSLGILTSAITSLNGLTNSTQTFATSTDTNITLSVTSSGSTHTFTPGWTGSLAVGRGGTGLGSTPTYGQLLIGNSSGGYTLSATSSLGLTTTDVIEGSRLYFTNARADARINATTSIGTLLGAPNLSTVGTITAGVWQGTAIGDAYLTKNGDWTGTFDGQEGSYYLNANNLTNFGTPFYSYFSATTTNALAEGNNNLYFTNARADARINATTTIGTLTSIPNLSTVGTIISGTWNASTLGVAYGGTGSTTLSGILKGNGTGMIQTAVPGTDYITSAITSLNGLTASTQTFATTSDTNITLSIVSSGSTHTLTPGWSGTLAVGRGGTGQTSFTNNQLLIGNGSGGISQVATSSLGLLTTNVNEGSNLYYTDARVNTYINASTTIAKTYSGNTFTGSNTFTGGITVGSLNGPLQANNGVISATTSIGVAYGGTGATSFSQGWIYSVGGTSALTSSTSPTVNYITSTGSATSTFLGGIQASALTITNLLGCDTIDTDANGYLICGGDAGAGGGITALNGLTDATQSFATSTDTNITLSIVSSGSTHTFTPGWTGSLAAARGGTGIINPVAGAVLVGAYSGGSWQQLATSSLGLVTTNVNEGTNLYYTDGRFDTRFGLKSTTDLAEGTNLYFTNARFDTRFASNLAGTSTTALVEGSNLYYTPERVNTLIHGSTTIPKTYSANVFSNANTFNGALTVGTLNGPLQANEGVVSATTSIGVLYGGTGLSSAPTYGQLLVGNSNGGYTLTATSSLGLLSAAITSIGPTGQTTTGPAVTLATSTSVTDGITSSLTVVGSGSTLTFTPSQSGTLTAAGGGTGINNPSSAGILVGGYGGGGWQQIATSSLGLLTTNVNEGSNLYFTNARADARVAVGIAGTTTDALAEGVTNLYWTNTRFDTRFASSLAGTTTTALAEGNNLYFTNTRADARSGVYINASTTIPKTYSANVFTAANTFNSVLTVGTLNGPLQANNGVVSATSSIGVLYGGTGLTSAPTYGQVLLGNALGGYTLTSTSSLGLVTAAITSLNGLTASTQTFATTTDTNITLSIVSSGSTHTFTPGWTGSLAAARGGTGISNPTAAGILIGDYAGGGWQQLATSSLGLLTTNVNEGSNLYYTQARFDAAFAATSTT